MRNIADDQEIASRLDKIFGSAGWFSEIDIRSNDGVVTLNGVADSQHHREWAETLARKTEDVVAVINRLTIQEQASFERTRGIVEHSLSSLWHDFLSRSPLLITALVILVFTALLSKITQALERRILERRKWRSSLKDLIYQLSSIAVWIAGFFTAVVVAFPGMTPAKAFTTLGVGTVAIGFAFKDIFENFFAGFFILWRYPFDRGDFIQCGELTGRVEEITIRNTMIRRLDGELAVVPNAYLFKNHVDVLTNQPQRRVRITCGIAYGEDVDRARKVIRNAVQSCDSVQGKRTVEVFAEAFSASSIDFEVAWWTGSKPVGLRNSRDKVVAAIKYALDDAGIEIPFLRRTLTFKDSRISQKIASR
ncbi:MAG: mechanosensitive ion channel family protein, partial [Planctomycetota bacterium]